MQDFHKKSVLIIGGTGFLGGVIASQFLKLKNDGGIDLRVVTASRRAAHIDLQSVCGDGVDRPDIHVQLDVRDGRMFERLDAVGVKKYDYVIHAGSTGATSQHSKNPTETQETSVLGTSNVLNWCKTAQIEKILYLSSGAIYGLPLQPKPWHETDDQNPVFDDKHSTYAESKRKAEDLCRSSGLPFVIARCFNFLGPMLPLNESYAIGNFIRNALRKEPIEIQGDGLDIRSYLDTNDFADWILSLLQSGQVGEAYNVGSSQAWSLIEVAQKVQKKMLKKNQNISISVLNRSPNYGRPKWYVPAIEKIQSQLRVKERYTLDESIERTLKYHESH